jgi:hypothetical protein
MLSVIDNLSSFVNWVNGVMSEQNITQADISRTGFVTRGAVSALLGLRIKSVGVEMCKAVSAATGIPLTVVMEKAGILPASFEMTPKKRQLLELAESADDNDVELAIAMLEASVKRKQKK